MGMKALEEFNSLYSGGKEFVVEQAPIVIKEYLTFSFMEGVINIIIPLILVLVGVIGLIILFRGVVLNKGSLRYREELDTASHKDSWYMARLVPCISIAFYTILVLPINIASAKTEAVNLAKIKYAPRVFMIEKSAELYKDLKK